MPFGAAIVPGGVRFRLWAPAAKRVELGIGIDDSIAWHDMARDASGWCERIIDGARAGLRYRYRIDGTTNVPDPASRYNADDVHGASEIIDPLAYEWRDGEWRGRAWRDAVIYELHVGTFTREGTFDGVARRLDYLADLGVTAIELMPIGDFPGRRNWGYDGVLPFAPDATYGRPEKLKALVEAAHARKLMVLLDVVYNHFGPEGNYLHLYAPDFFTERHATPWGAALNFDGERSRVVRDFFIHNALYWLEEFHIDGLRLDAVHAIIDESAPDILAELATTVRELLGQERLIHLVLENDRNEAHRLVRDDEGRPRYYTAQWNDDVHHALHAIVTRERQGYYDDYVDAPITMLGRCLAEGFAYQGEVSRFRGGRARGESSAALPPTAFISFLQNHDQVGNRALGERLTTIAPDEHVRAAAAIVMLAPMPPLLFMGEEFHAATPFLFFCDFQPELAAAVTKGRHDEFRSFALFADPVAAARIPDPSDADTFQRCKLDWDSADGGVHAEWLALYRRLLAVRRAAIVPVIDAIVVDARTWRTWADTGLTASWPLVDGRVLRLDANLADGAAQLDDAPSAQSDIVYATHDVDARQRTLLPWSAIWRIDRAQSGRTSAR